MCLMLSTNMQRGLIQIYTGDGKGKTTAALGLALRALGAGMRVYLGQFIKKGSTSEIKALRRFHSRITIRQYGRGCFVKGQPVAADIQAARQGLKEIRQMLACRKYDLIICDEIICALKAGLIGLQDIMQLLDAKPPAVELVLTGRDAPKKIIKRADLVTEMRKVRHPFEKGIQARKGIEY